MKCHNYDAAYSSYPQGRGAELQQDNYDIIAGSQGKHFSYFIACIFIHVISLVFAVPLFF